MITIPETFNVATYFVDRNILEGRGSNVAIECGGAQISYRQLQERTNRVGNVLQQFGVRIEERVAILLPDTPEFLYSFFAAIKIGAVAVPLNTYLRADDYEYFLNDTRAPVLLAHHSLLPTLDLVPADRLRYLQRVVVVGGQDSR